MVAICGFELVLILCVLLPRYQVTSVADHPPVLEGQNVVLTCSGHSTSTKKRSLQWMTTEPGQDTVNRAICYSTEPSCRNYYNTKFIVNASFTDTHYTTTLTILKVSQSERSMVVDCRLYEKERDMSYNIQTWNMWLILARNVSNIISPPDNPACISLYSSEDSTVNISCSTSKVFPGIVCRIFEVYDDNTEYLLTNPEIKYNYKESNISGYRSAECNVVTRLSKPGIYKYKVDMYPGLSNSDLYEDAATRVYTNVVGKPEVYIKSSPVCKKDNTTVHHLVCTSRWLPSPANLDWFKNTTLISNTTTTTSVDTGFYTSQSSVELHSMTSSEEPIQCRANFKARDTAQNKTIHIQVRVCVTSPSVYFTYKEMILGRQLILEEGKTISKLECKVNGSGPLLVECQMSGQVNKFSSVTESVSFDIPAITTTDTVICYCSVAGTSECCKPKVHITFSCRYAAYSLSTFQSSRSGSYINNICYIVAGFIGLTFLVFLIGTVMFLASKWDKLYMYVYGTVHSAETPEVVNNGHLYYSVPNAATSGVLTQRLGGLASLQTENIVENDRDFTTPSPSSFHSEHVYSNEEFHSDEDHIQYENMNVTLHPSRAEIHNYINLKDSVVPKLAVTQLTVVADPRHDKSTASNGLAHTSDLFISSLDKYNTTIKPPKPCKINNCPDLLLHRV